MQTWPLCSFINMGNSGWGFIIWLLCQFYWLISDFSSPWLPEQAETTLNEIPNTVGAYNYSHSMPLKLLTYVLIIHTQWHPSMLARAPLMGSIYISSTGDQGNMELLQVVSHCMQVIYKAHSGAVIVSQAAFPLGPLCWASHSCSWSTSQLQRRLQPPSIFFPIYLSFLQQPSSLHGKVPTLSEVTTAPSAGCSPSQYPAVQCLPVVGKYSSGFQNLHLSILDNGKRMNLSWGWKSLLNFQMHHFVLENISQRTPQNFSQSLR